MQRGGTTGGNTYGVRQKCPPKRQESRRDSRAGIASPIALSLSQRFYSVFVRCLSVHGTLRRDRRNAPTSCAPVQIDFTQLLKILRHGSELGSAVLPCRNLRSRVRRLWHTDTHTHTHIHVRKYIYVRGRSVKAGRKRKKKDVMTFSSSDRSVCTGRCACHFTSNRIFQFRCIEKIAGLFRCVCLWSISVRKSRTRLLINAYGSTCNREICCYNRANNRGNNCNYL